MTHYKTESTSTLEALEIQALYQIAQMIGSALDLDMALAEILRILHDTLRMERATLVLMEGADQRLAIRASYGLTERERQRGVYRVGEGIIGKIFKEAYPCVVPDIAEEPLFLNRTGARARFSKGETSFIGVPVILVDEPVGVLTVDRLFGPEISFEEDIRFLTVVAMLIAQFLSLNNAVKKKEELLVAENLSLKAEFKKRFSHHNIIGHGKAMQGVFRTIDKVAPSTATALLLGESGTGKELVARAVHLASLRRDQPFIKVNCAALPENLLESELLGHEKGAFTGATSIKLGRFELADKGTLFLDEIGELPLELQAKLLRVIQEKQFERLGGTRTIRVDVRIIAATNISLEQAVRENSFRADLYYRLNVVPILLPPLRERQEDIPFLLEHFLRISNRENNRQVAFSRDVLDFLCTYNWPGNVRELQNLVERLVIMADRNLVRMADLPTFMRAEPEESVGTVPAPVSQPRRPGPTSPGQSLQDLERQQVEAALKRNGWVQARAARELGLTQRQIGYRIKKFGLRSPFA